MQLLARHTSASRALLVLLVGLALLQLRWSQLVGAGDAVATATLLLPVSLVAAAMLAHANSFESRLAVVLAFVAQLVVVALALSVGLPGTSRTGLDLRAAEALLLPVVGLLLVGQDRRQRHAASPGPQPPAPYAR